MSNSRIATAMRVAAAVVFAVIAMHGAAEAQSLRPLAVPEAGEAARPAPPILNRSATFRDIAPSYSAAGGALAAVESFLLDQGRGRVGDACA